MPFERACFVLVLRNCFETTPFMLNEERHLDEKLALIFIDKDNKHPQVPTKRSISNFVFFSRASDVTIRSPSRLTVSYAARRPVVVAGLMSLAASSTSSVPMLKRTNRMFSAQASSTLGFICLASLSFLSHVAFDIFDVSDIPDFWNGL